MNKFFALIAVLGLSFGIAACGGKKDEAPVETPGTTPTETPGTTPTETPGTTPTETPTTPPANG